MAIGAEQHQADKWAALALDRLKKDGLIPSPQNFALFYHYYADQNPNLRMSLDLLVSQNSTLTQAQCDDLHRAHLGLEAEHKLLKDASAAIETEANRLIELVNTSSKDAAHFGQNLDVFSGTLTHSATLEHIRSSVEKVTNETRVMCQQNARLQQQLALATEQLAETRYNLDVIHKETLIDPLTEVGNRKFFDREIEHAIVEASSDQASLTLLVIDIDHFKKFNDTYGHQIGDQVLRLVARTLVENLKGRDVIARYGGEEFVILLPRTTVHDGERVGNQLRASLGTKQIKRRSTNESLGIVTVSIGAAEYCGGESIDDFIARADSALYRAKQTGRNKVMTDILSAEQVAAIESKRHAS